MLLSVYCTKYLQDIPCIYQREWCDLILQVPASEYCTETRNWPNRVLSSEHMVCSSSTSLVNGSNEMSHSARPATVGPPKGHLLSESKRFRHCSWSVWSPLRVPRQQTGLWWRKPTSRKRGCVDGRCVARCRILSPFHGACVKCF